MSRCRPNRVGNLHIRRAPELYLAFSLRINVFDGEVVVSSLTLEMFAIRCRNGVFLKTHTLGYVNRSSPRLRGQPKWQKEVDSGSVRVRICT